jgi:hypothetical protein
MAASFPHDPASRMPWVDPHGGLVRGGDNDTTGVNRTSAEGQRKSFEKSGI